MYLGFCLLLFCIFRHSMKLKSLVCCYFKKTDFKLIAFGFFFPEILVFPPSTHFLLFCPTFPLSHATALIFICMSHCNFFIATLSDHEVHQSAGTGSADRHRGESALHLRDCAGKGGFYRQHKGAEQRRVSGSRSATSFTCRHRNDL